MALFGIGRAPRSFEFRCGCCGEMHRGSPSFAYDRPPLMPMSDEEFERRVKLSDDLCRVLPPEDDPDRPWDFWLRGILEIPIHEVDEPFTWGVWVSQSQDSFERYHRTFDEDQSADGSFGWLPNTIPIYNETPDPSETDNFAADVRWGKPGQRPQIELHEVDHPLYRDQVEGISWDRAVELAMVAMHGRAET